MKHHLIRSSLPLALAALALSACGEKQESFNDTVVDPQASELANAAPVAAPPPMIKSSHSYRCKDNSLIYVDFMTDDLTANFKSAKDGPISVLKAPEVGQPFVSEDGSQTVTGSGEQITHNGTSCKAG